MNDTKNIAKNSLFLYSRMLLNMTVGLFTAGITLNVLGITDYGIYNVVAGFVSMFGFLNASMSSATQRFLSFDLGKNDQEQLRKTFSTTVTIHFLIGLIVILALETFGVWYINNKLNVPAERLPAINIIFQFSVFSTFFGIIQVPYNALITAHERFNVYAYISFLEIAFKIIILILIVHVSYDKLILYSGLLFCSSFIIRMIYRIYCRRNFKESKYEFYYERTYFKTLMSFMGWNLFGYIAALARVQGNNLVLNSFFGVTINAAYGISQQFQGVISSFASNFQVAVNPQIVKSYANNEKERTRFLIKQSSKFSYFLMFVILIPIVFNLEFILKTWIKIIPPFTIPFLKISIIGILLDTISNPMMTAARAYGKIKLYQIVISITVFLSLPISYLLLRIKQDPTLVFSTVVSLNLVALFIRIYFINKMIGFKRFEILKEVLLKVMICSIVIIVFAFLIDYNFGKAETIVSLILSGIVYFTSSAAVVFLLGITNTEKRNLYNLIKKRK